MKEKIPVEGFIIRDEAPVGSQVAKSNQGSSTKEGSGSVYSAKLFALASVPFVLVLANSMIIPVLPDLQKGMDISLFQAGLLITAFSIPGGLSIPIGGYLADHVGRKKVIIPSLALYGLGGLIAALAPLFFDQPYWAIFGGRVVQGLGAGGMSQVAMALVGDIYQSRERSQALGILEFSNGIGKVISPILGAAVGLLIWYAPFYVYPVLAWSSAVAAWLLVQEPKQTGARDMKAPRYFKALKKVWHRIGVSVSLTYLAGFVGLFLLFGVLSWFSDVLERSFDIRGFNKGLVIAVPVLVMAATSYGFGILYQKTLRPYMKWGAVLGLVLGALGLGLVLPAGSVWSMVGAISLLGLGNGIMLPGLNNLITGCTHTEERGMVTGLYGTVRFFGAALGPPTFNRLDRLGQEFLSLGAAGLAAVAAVALAIWLNQHRMLKAEREEQKKQARTRDQGGSPESRPGESPA